jgi:hypothetical protein
MKKLFALLICWASVWGAQAQRTPTIRSKSPDQVRIGLYQLVDFRNAYNRAYLYPQQELGRWLVEGTLAKKIMPYYYVAPNDKYIARTMTLGAFRQKLKYYDDAVGDSVEVNPADMTLLELKLHIETDSARNQLAEKIERLSIFYFNPNQRKPLPIATFSYAEARKYLKKKFKKSLRARSFEGLKAAWYPALRQRQLVGMHQALEQHWYVGKLLYNADNPTGEFRALTPQDEAYKKIYGKHLPRYAPDTNLQLKPYFVPVGKHKTQTNLWYQLDLRHPNNDPLNTGKHSLSAALVQGIRAGKIKAYYHSSAPFIRRKANRMSLKDFERHLSYVENNDTLKLAPERLHLVGLQGTYAQYTRKNKAKMQPKALTLMIPQGTTNETAFGNLRVANIAYRQAIKYLKKLRRRQPTHYSWVSNFINQQYKAQLVKFSHPQNDYLENILLLKFPNFSLEQVKQKASKVGLEVDQSLKR